MTNDIEILAPAGSFEALKIAIDSGADAVYFGGSKFSARKNAVNLTDEEIEFSVKYAHLRGAKIYAAVNTLVFDSELNEVFEYLKFLYESGVDAIIVQDLGTAGMIRKYFPDMRMHASTQMTIHNLHGAIMAEKLGFSRVVLSRELSCEEIKHIADNCKIELEVFCHGALCMSYSGQCLMSSFLGGRSGNRGYCAQPCRLNYSLFDSGYEEISEKNKYLLSLKDLCLIDYIKTLKICGVKSLKIEGRMKNNAYVSAVSGLYNKYRDGSLVSETDKTLLMDVFSRGGFTDGYFNGDTGRHMLNYGKGNDDIYDSVTDDVINSALDLSKKAKKYLLKANFYAKPGAKAILEVKFDGCIFRIESAEVVECALKKPMTSERIKQNLEKLGGTVFEYKSLDVDLTGDIFISAKDLNDMRRRLIADIEEHLIGSNPVYSGDAFEFVKISSLSDIKKPRHACVLNKTQAQTAYDLGFERIYIPYSLYLENKKRYDDDPDVFSVMLPPVCHDSKEFCFDKIATESVCITNIGQINALEDKYVLYSDYRMNVCNSMSMKELFKLDISQVCLSPELTLSQIKKMGNLQKSELVIYGKVSLMTLKNCVVKSSLNKCGKNNTDDLYYLKDRKGIFFPLIKNCLTCTNVIYNSMPIYMADRIHELSGMGVGAFRFDFVDETEDEMRRIVEKYDKALKSDKPFTRGHFYNGVI